VIFEEAGEFLLLRLAGNAPIRAEAKAGDTSKIEILPQHLVEIGRLLVDGRVGADHRESLIAQRADEVRRILAGRSGTWRRNYHSDQHKGCGDDSYQRRNGGDVGHVFRDAPVRDAWQAGSRANRHRGGVAGDESFASHLALRALSVVMRWDLAFWEAPCLTLFNPRHATHHAA